MCEPSTDKWKAEYREAGECFRVYTTFLISIVKGITAGNAVLFAALAYLIRAGSETVLVAVLGILASFGAIGIQNRTYKYWRIFLSRAADIEKANGLELYTSANAIAARGLIRSSVVVLFVYGVLALFWFMILISDAPYFMLFYENKMVPIIGSVTKTFDMIIIHILGFYLIFIGTWRLATATRKAPIGADVYSQKYEEQAYKPWKDLCSPHKVILWMCKTLASFNKPGDYTDAVILHKKFNWGLLWLLLGIAVQFVCGLMRGN